MKAIVYTEYGPPEVLQLKEVLKPVPKDNEILIKIFATAVNSGDWRLRKADPWAVRLLFGLSKPRKIILGSVLSGEVESVGKTVTKFKVGDQVFGATGMSFGTYAEYICLSEGGILAIKPNNLTHQQACVIPFGGTAALYFLRKANIKKGQKILIYGASGSIGTAAVQIAKYYGATVTGVCSTSNLDMVKSIGADYVIDYTNEDFTLNGEKYDVIFETVNKLSFAESITSLNRNGILILGASGLSFFLNRIWSFLTSRRKIIAGIITQNASDVNFLKQLIEKGNFKSIIDRSYTLEQMIAAHTYVESGHKKGNVAIILN